MQMMATADAGSIAKDARRRKHPTPPPFPRRRRILPLQGINQPRHAHRGSLILQERLSLLPDPAPQRRYAAIRERRPPVLVTLSTANDYLAPIQVHVLRGPIQRLRPALGFDATTALRPAPAERSTCTVVSFRATTISRSPLAPRKARMCRTSPSIATPLRSISTAPNPPAPSPRSNSP